LREAWFGPNKKAFTGLKSYYDLALPSTIALVLDCWVFELMVLISGLLGVTE